MNVKRTKNSQNAPDYWQIVSNSTPSTFNGQQKEKLSLKIGKKNQRMKA